MHPPFPTFRRAPSSHLDVLQLTRTTRILPVPRKCHTSFSPQYGSKSLPAANPSPPHLHVLYKHLRGCPAGLHLLPDLLHKHVAIGHGLRGEDRTGVYKDAEQDDKACLKTGLGKPPNRCVLPFQ